MEKGFEEEYKEGIRTWESGLSSPRSAFGGKGEENTNLKWKVESGKLKVESWKTKDVFPMFLELNTIIAYSND